MAQDSDGSEVAGIAVGDVRRAPRRLVLFAHYDGHARVRRYIVEHLRALGQIATEIRFISTSPLPEQEQAKLRPHCSRVQLVDNVGFDFSMWSRAIRELDLSEWDEIVLTNSSIFGPVTPLQAAFTKMAARNCDFWAMTDNLEIAYHLQSYFLVFRRRLLESEAFRQFWTSVLPYRTKNQVIRSYEVGLSTHFIEQGFRPEAVVGLPELYGSGWRRRTHRSNPTCKVPVRLLRKGVPYVKAELLRENPLNVPLAPVLRELRTMGFDLDLLEFDRRPRLRPSRVVDGVACLMIARRLYLPTTTE